MSRAELNESATIMADEFGSVGTYTPVVGTPVTVAPVMTYGFQLIDDFGAYELRDRANIDMAEYPGEPEQGDSLVVGDDSYTVDTWEQVGSMWHITLRIGVAPAPPVDTTPPYITTIQVNGGLGIATSRTVSVDVLIAADDMSSVLDMTYLVNTVPGTPPSTMDPGWLSYANRLTAVTVPADGNYTFTGYAKDEAGNVSIGQEFAQQQVFIDSIAPEVVSGQVDVTGLVLTIGMSEAVTGNIGFSMTADGLDVALSNPTAPDASTIQFDVAQIFQGKVLLLSYTAGDVVDQVGNPLSDFAGQSVTNNSDVSEFLVPVLSAFTYDPDTFEVQDKAIGVGSVATSRVAVINVPDDQGTYKQVPTGAIAYHGARYVGDVAYADDGAGTLLDPQPYAAVAPVSTNYFLNSQAPVTQDVGGRTGAHTVSVIGAGTVTLSGGMTGVASEGSPVTGDPGGVTVTCTVSGGPPANVQFEGNATATYPIYTTTVPVTRDKDTITVDSANLANAEGSLYFDLIPGGDTSALFGAFLEMDNGFACLDDGVHTNAAAALVDTSKPSQIGMVWSSAGMQINVNGTWSQLVPHDGDLLSGALGVLTDAPTVGRIKDLKIWDAEDKALIESLMPVAEDFGTDMVLVAKTTSASEVFTLQCGDTGAYAASIDWGDGTPVSDIATFNDADLAHTYVEPGNHVVHISGALPHLYLNNSAGASKLTGVINGGSTSMASLQNSFYGCNEAIVIDLLSLDGAAVTRGDWIARNCSKLRTVRLPSNAGLASNYDFAFGGNLKLSLLDMSNMQFSSVTSIGALCYGDTSLIKVDMSGLDASALTSIADSYFGCPKLKEVDFSGWTVPALRYASSTFMNCSEIVDVDLTGFDFGLVQNVSSICRGCLKLVNLTPEFIGTADVVNNSLNALYDARVLSQQSQDAILQLMYENRMNYTWATPDLYLASPADPPSGIYQDATPPTTGQEFRYKLENDPDGEGFNTWTITV